MGYTDVFTHVGEAVKVQAPDGRMVVPVVTGSSLPLNEFPIGSECPDEIGVFGADDFMHSLFAGQPSCSVPTSCAEYLHLRGV